VVPSARGALEEMLAAGPLVLLPAYPAEVGHLRWAVAVGVAVAAHLAPAPAGRGPNREKRQIIPDSAAASAHRASAGEALPEAGPDPVGAAAAQALGAAWETDLSA
jgi:hypothetical protein